MVIDGYMTVVGLYLCLQYGKYDEDDYKYSEKYAETAQYAYGKDTYKVRRPMYQVYELSPRCMPESACTPKSASCRSGIFKVPVAVKYCGTKLGVRTMA
jgi:hypothetical protein